MTLSRKSGQDTVRALPFAAQILLARMPSAMTRASLIVACVLAATTSAYADHGHHGYHGHCGHGGPHFSFGFFSAPPVYMAPPPVYAPPPVQVYAPAYPAPVYAAPPAYYYYPPAYYNRGMSFYYGW